MRDARGFTRRRPRRSAPAPPRVGKGRKPTPLPLTILYEDAQLVAVQKPSGLLVVPDRFDPEQPTLFDAVWYHLYQGARERPPEESLPRLVHRLDRGTSGVVVFAKTYEAQRALSRAFEGNLVKKRYLALVAGQLSGERVIDEPLAPLRKKKGLMVVDPAGKPARTEVRALETFARHSLVEALPRTGRQHQIRVHLAFIGHPLCFDPPYRRSEAEPEIAAVCPRLTLHAAQLTLPHPETGEDLVLDAPLPEDFQQAIEAARKMKP